MIKIFTFTLQNNTINEEVLSEINTLHNKLNIKLTIDDNNFYQLKINNFLDNINNNITIIKNNIEKLIKDHIKYKIDEIIQLFINDMNNYIKEYNNYINKNIENIQNCILYYKNETNELIKEDYLKVIECYEQIYNLYIDNIINISKEYPFIFKYNNNVMDKYISNIKILLNIFNIPINDKINNIFNFIDKRIQNIKTQQLNDTIINDSYIIYK